MQTRRMVFAIVAVAGLVTMARADSKMGAKMEGASSSRSSWQLRQDMRKLWEDHITYTRNYIISGLAGLEDADMVAGRLLLNQDDIGRAIEPYYGAEAGRKLSALLRDHILIAARIVKAARAGDKDIVTAEQRKWRVNADQIATLLSGANPHWPKATLLAMMNKHLDLTTDEVTARIKRDWRADIAAYDKGHEHMLMFADALSDGIVKQFPKRFTK